MATTGVIDTRLLGKPPRFEGDIGEWKQWRFQVMSYFGALDGLIVADLKKSEEVEVVIVLSTLTEEQQRGARVVYYVLSQLLIKAPLQVLMSVEEGNGYEAWRMLKRDYEPDSGSRHIAMLSSILRPSFPEGHQEYWEALRRWINEVESYERSSNEFL